MQRMKSEGDQSLPYEAFVSYSHSERDALVARMIQRFVENYSIPRALRARAGRACLGKVFRDEADLAAGPSLAARLQEALEDSRWLIVVCSPAAAASQWVNREVETFVACHGREHVLAVLVAGDPDEAFPPALMAVEAAGPDDGPADAGLRDAPLAADLRHAPHRREQRLELLRVVATLIGCDYDDLVRRQHARFVQRVAAAAAVTLAVVAGVGAMLLHQQGLVDASARAAQEASAENLSARALSLLEDGRRMEAIELGIEALEAGELAGSTTSAIRALSDALGVYQSVLGTGPVYTLTGIGDASTVEVSASGGWMACSESGRGLDIYDIETGALRFTLGSVLDSDGEAHSADGSAAFDVGGSLLVTYGDRGLAAVDPETGATFWTREFEGSIWDVEALDDARRIAVLILNDDGSLTCQMLDVTDNSIVLDVSLDLVSDGTVPCAMDNEDDRVAIATATRVAIVDLETGDVSYAAIDAPELSDIELVGETLVVLEQSGSVSDGDTQASARITAYDLGDSSLMWEYTCSWDAYELDFTTTPFLTDATIAGVVEDGALGECVLLVSAGNDAIALDATCGDVLLELTAQAPLVQLTCVTSGGSGVVRATDVMGGRLVARLAAGQEFLEVDGYEYPGYVWRADEVIIGDARYAIGCSAEETGSVYVYRDALNDVPDASGVICLSDSISSGGVFVSDDATRVALFDGATAIQVLDASTLEALSVIDVASACEETGDVSSLSVFFVDEDSDLLVLSTPVGADCMPHLWLYDVLTGDLVATWSWPYAEDGNAAPNTELSAERSGHVTVKMPDYGYAALVDTSTLETTREFAISNVPLCDVWYARDDRIIVVYAEDMVALYDGDTGESVGDALDEVLVEEDMYSGAWAVSPDGALLGVISLDGALLLIDLDSGELVWSVPLDAAGVEFIVFTPAGDELIVQDENRTLMLIDAETGATRAELDEELPLARMCTVSEDGSTLYLITTDLVSDTLYVVNVGDDQLEVERCVPLARCVDASGAYVFCWLGSSVYAQPLYTADELRQMGEEVLARHEAYESAR